MVFEDKTVGTFINKHFISIKINSQEPDGKIAKKQYQVLGNPTVIFLTPQGKEIDRLCGFYGKEEYVVALDYIFSGKWKGAKTNSKPLLQSASEIRPGKNLLDHYLVKLQKQPENVHFNFIVGMKYSLRWADEDANQYFRKVLELDPKDVSGYKDEATFRLVLYEARSLKIPDPLHDFMRLTSVERYYSRGYSYLIRCLSTQEPKDLTRLYSVYEEALEKMPSDADMMNSYAWSIYENKSRSKYKRGIELANRAVIIRPKAANIWDTLAWLLYATGEYEAARSAMQKAVDLAPDVEDFKKNLEKIEKRLI